MAISVGPLTVNPVPAGTSEVTVLTWDGQAVSLATAVSLDGSNNVSFAVNSAGRYRVDVKNATFPGSIGHNLVDVIDPNDSSFNPYPQYRKATEKVNVVAASGAAQTVPDPSTARYNDITLTGACTLTFPAATAGKSFTLRLKQDATGSRLVTWPASAKWVGGAAPTLSTTGAKVDYVEFRCVDGTTWWGTAALDVR
jgi:hypothetical protein